MYQFGGKILEILIDRLLGLGVVLDDEIIPVGIAEGELPEVDFFLNLGVGRASPKELDSDSSGVLAGDGGDFFLGERE